MKKDYLLIRGTDIGIVSKRVCKYCAEEYPLYSLEKEQYDKNDFKYPDSCPTCTFRLSYVFFNDKHLYNRKDTQTGSGMISILSDDYQGNVMEGGSYRNKLADGLGSDFSQDIQEDVFGQFLRLYRDFPKPSRLIFQGVENGMYSSHCGTSKNLYLSYCVFADCEDVYYSFKVSGWSKNVFDSCNIISSSNIYGSHTIGTSYDISFSRNSVNSSALLFCSDMNNCQECIFCCNQVNASYMVYNKRYSPQEYQKIKEGIYEKLKDYGQYEFLQRKFREFLDENLIDASININNCQKVNGESTFYSFNSINTYVGMWLSSCINTLTGGDFAEDKNVNVINSVEFWSNCENIVGSFSFGYNVYNVHFSGFVASSSDIDYCMDMEWCENCLFCVWLRNKKYCILNKQYEKEEYFGKREEIISRLKEAGRWWESLPWSLSPYPYNDTLAYDYFKVNKVVFPDGREELINPEAIWTVKVLWNEFISDAELDLWWTEKIAIKWRTRNKEINIPENMETLRENSIPDIGSANDDILNKAIICKETGRPFRVIKPELDYLKKKWFPIPRVHHENRIDAVFSDRPTGQMFVGTCDNCQQETLSVFKNKPKCQVYCADCYKQYMYG